MSRRRRRVSWPASGGDWIGFDGADVPAVAVHDGQLVAQRPLDAGVVRGRDLDGHPVVSRLRDRAHRAHVEHRRGERDDGGGVEVGEQVGPLAGEVVRHGPLGDGPQRAVG